MSPKPGTPWEPAEDAILRAIYKDHSDCAVSLVEAARILGRSKFGVAIRASRLGLTDRRAKSRPETRERFSQTVKLQYQFGREHPRGSLGTTNPGPAGMKHTDEARAKMRASFTPKKRKKMAIDASVAMTSNGNAYSRTKSGRRADLGGQFFRSRWEANIARWLTMQGIAWQYEPKTFIFEKIQKGTRAYTPDFYLPAEDRYIEVKGWMDKKSQTKLRRMAKYFPEVKIELIDQRRYKEIADRVSAIIPNWE